MEGGTREVAKGIEVVNGAGQAFQEITKAVNMVSQQIQEMSAASQEMAASAETAIEAIEATTKTAMENAQSANKISDIAQDQMAGVEEMDVAIDKLTEVIAGLEQSVAFFKIEAAS